MLESGSQSTRADPPQRHIFLSYQRDDRERAHNLARAFECRGWAVWWDRNIRAGQSFRKVIGDALDGAACTVVLWTHRSVGSDWVHEEAEVARQRGTLVPVLLDDVEPPLGFRQIHAADAIAWDGSPEDSTLSEVLEAVADVYQLRDVPPLTSTSVSEDPAVRKAAPEPTATDDRSAVWPFCRRCGTATVEAKRFCRRCGDDVTRGHI